MNNLNSFKYIIILNKPHNQYHCVKVNQKNHRNDKKLIYLVMTKLEKSMLALGVQSIKKVMEGLNIR